MPANPEILQKADVRENRMSGNVTEVLAGFAASLQYDDLPGSVRDHCKNVLLDPLACAVPGHRGEETEQLAALASGLAQSTESSVLGGRPPALPRAPSHKRRPRPPVARRGRPRPPPPPVPPPRH